MARHPKYASVDVSIKHNSSKKNSPQVLKAKIIVKATTSLKPLGKGMLDYYNSNDSFTFRENTMFIDCSCNGYDAS